MYQNRADYDRGVNTFSPEGRLFQVEYAIEAIKLGSTAIGILCSEGVVLAVEKRLTSPLIVPESIEKIYEIDRKIACAVSGLTADAKMLVEHARVEVQEHWFKFNESIGVENLTQSICDMALRFGENGATDKAILSRPFGVALLIAGIDDHGPHLYFADPSGTLTKYNAKAIGSGSEIAQDRLKEIHDITMSLDQAVKTSLEVLKSVMEDKISATNIQVATVSKDHGFVLFSTEEVSSILTTLS